MRRLRAETGRTTLTSWRPSPPLPSPAESQGAAADVAQLQTQLAQLNTKNQELEHQNGELHAELAELRSVNGSRELGPGWQSLGPRTVAGSWGRAGRASVRGR